MALFTDVPLTQTQTQTQQADVPQSCILASVADRQVARVFEHPCDSDERIRAATRPGSRFPRRI